MSASPRGSASAKVASHWSRSASSGVVVGLWSRSVSEIDPAHHQAGDLRRRAQAGGAEHVRDDRAGGAERPVDEQDGLMRGRVAQAVVVDDFRDLDLGGAVDGLRELVVVHQDELRARRVDDVGLREHADQAAVLVDDMADERGVL